MFIAPWRPAIRLTYKSATECSQGLPSEPLEEQRHQRGRMQVHLPASQNAVHSRSPGPPLMPRTASGNMPP
eukprot:15502075-Heterocapsa_arctica.AAC.1